MNNSKDNNFILPASIMFAAIILSGAWIYTAGLGTAPAEKPVTGEETQKGNVLTESEFTEIVLPKKGVALPVVWGDTGARLIESGVIDAEKFEALYRERGGLSADEKKLLTGEGNARFSINSQNAGALLNLLWAFGLANKNPILENGPMQDPERGGDASRFASTGGWTLAKGDAMEHYSRHAFVSLTDKEQQIVERVSQGIFRPCCGNATYFPDCNHGMAMLGLLELMASQGVSESEMYRVALAVNSFWFPETYLTLAKYFLNKGVAWGNVDAKTVLGAPYSSTAGYRSILTEIQPVEKSGGGGCGV